MAQRRSLQDEYRRTIEAQMRLAPQQFQLDQIYKPLENSLNLQNIDEFLTGTADQEYMQYAWQAPVYKMPNGRRRGGSQSLMPGMGGMPGMGAPGLPGAPYIPGVSGSPGSGVSRYIPTPLDTVDPVRGVGKILGLFGGDDKPKKKLISKGKYVAAGMATRKGQRGYLDIYSDDIMPALDAAQRRSLSYQREGDIADIQRLGPAAREALRVSDPDSARILDLYNDDAVSGMELGPRLDGGQAREVREMVGRKRAGLGMGVGPVDAYIEAMQTGSAGEALRASRRATAANAVAMNQNFYGNPFQTILNRPGAGAGAGLGAGQQAIGASNVASSFNKESAYAGDLYNTNLNSAVAAAMNAANNRSALIGAGISAVGSLGGGAMKMM